MRTSNKAGRFFPQTSLYTIMKSQFAPQLQIAVDLPSLDAAIELLNKVAVYIDIIEAGTPLIKQEGLKCISEFKRRFPGKLIFADMKTMDAGMLEADLAFQAGADLTTVLALA